jgi:hypothetical protein
MNCRRRNIYNCCQTSFTENRRFMFVASCGRSAAKFIWRGNFVHDSNYVQNSVTKLSRRNTKARSMKEADLVVGSWNLVVRNVPVRWPHGSFKFGIHCCITSCCVALVVQKSSYLKLPFLGIPSAESLSHSTSKTIYALTVYSRF